MKDNPNKNKFNNKVGIVKRKKSCLNDVAFKQDFIGIIFLINYLNLAATSTVRFA